MHRLRHLLNLSAGVPAPGQYAYPVRIVAFNAIEGWARDVTSEFADELAQAAAKDAEITPALQAFVEANATRPFALQLALPLRGVAQADSHTTPATSSMMGRRP